MAQFDLVMPKMGESVAEATIIKWNKNVGDKIEADETVLEIATDKVDSEVPAPKGGILLKKLFNDGDVVQVGTVIALLGDSAGDSATSSSTIFTGLDAIQAICDTLPLSTPPIPSPITLPPRKEKQQQIS
jgi:pyruvate/2-oxoglutarate dehydrogenase complex dihydrolipoamide acyltransferase (E2) component